MSSRHAARRNRRPLRTGHRLPRRQPPSEPHTMDHVYKQIELTGSSPVSSDEAIRKAIGKAGETVRRIEWFEVTDMRGQVAQGEVAHWRMTLKVGFRLDS